MRNNPAFEFWIRATAPGSASTRAGPDRRFTYSGTWIDGMPCGQHGDIGERLEASFIATVIAFMLEADVVEVTLRQVVNAGLAEVPYLEGQVILLDNAGTVMKAAIREEIRCRFESARSYAVFEEGFSVRVGVPSPCPAARMLANELGFIVTEEISPERG